MILWSRFPELGRQVMHSVGSFYDLAYHSTKEELSLFIRKTYDKNFHNYKGFGKNTIGGQGGEVYVVENLNASGAGSLREGIQKQGSRMIQFAVSGTIALVQPLVVKNPYLTIDGVSASGSGIALEGAGIRIETSEVVVSHLKIRVGDRMEGPDPEERDGISIYVPRDSKASIENVVIDHCSVSWAVDEKYWFVD